MLLSIKPCYVEQIYSGRKKFEYRKSRCISDVNQIVIYATAPVKQIIGEFDVTEIINNDVNTVWEYTKDFSGIDQIYFNEYYKGKKFAIAYGIGNLKAYPNGIAISEINISHAPQSFCYLSEQQSNELSRIVARSSYINNI